MRRRWGTRVKAVILASLLFSGGGGMPVLDLALFHVYPGSHSSGGHIDVGRVPVSHRVHCTLGTGIGHTTVPSELRLAIPVTAFEFCDASSVRDLYHPSAVLALLSAPRAPPALIA